MPHHTKIKILIATTIVFISKTVFAAEPKGYQPLSGEGAEKILPGLTGGDPVQMFNGLYKWGVGIAILLAVLMVVVGGIKYMTTDAIYDKGEGKKMIQNAFLGLLIVLSSYTILYAINPKILEIHLDFSKLGSKAVSVPANKPATDPNPYGTNENPKLPVTDLSGPLPLPPENNPDVPYGDPLTEMTTRDTLKQFGILTNNANASDNRTLVGGLRQSTKEGIVTMKREMLPVENLVLTAGNEKGYGGVNHTKEGDYTHEKGYKVDIGKGSNSANWNQISKYFEENSGSGPIVPYSPRRGIMKNGQPYAVTYENAGDAHYDVTFFPNPNPPTN